MSNRQITISLIFIILLALIAGIFCYPNPYNNLVKDINSKYNWKIPQAPEKVFKLGLDLQGGVHLEYQADLSQVKDVDKGEIMEGVRDLIERRVNVFGVAEPIVQIYSESRLIVEIPGMESIEQAIAWIGETPLLEFGEEKSAEEIQKILDKRQEFVGKTGEEIMQIADWQLGLESLYNKTELTGRHLKKASLSYNQTTYEPIVDLEFNAEGIKLFEQITERNAGKTLAIFLDNQSIIDTNGDGTIDAADLYAPRVSEKISGGKAMISGIKNVEEAKTIVKRLNQGALPVPLGDPIVQKKIGPTLGAISLNNAVKAGGIGIVSIIIFLILFYRLPGLLASLALLIYVVVLFALVKLIPITMTLAGIGGFILSVGMAVDANILIFSRMREEIKSGKDVSFSIKEGIERAWPSIRDGNLTTIIVALILYFLGTSFIRAFAFALILGILLSIFSALFISNVFLQVFAKSKLGKIKFLWS